MPPTPEAEPSLSSGANRIEVRFEKVSAPPRRRCVCSWRRRPMDATTGVASTARAIRPASGIISQPRTKGTLNAIPTPS